MTITQALVLGLIQGITEFLPVSSSGHLIFLPAFFHWSDQGIVFDVIVHLGTLLAVIFYFRKRLWRLIQSFFSRATVCLPERRLAFLLLGSVVPAIIVGYFLESNSRSTLVVGISLIFWGFWLAIADRYHARRVRLGQPRTDLRHLRLWQVVSIAFSQAIALIPGTSRSGITITTGLLVGLDKKSAAEFSFLMSIPIIALAGLSKIVELVYLVTPQIDLTVLVIGFFSSAISGWLAISILMKVIERWNFLPFAIYRVLVGVAIIFFLV